MREGHRQVLRPVRTAARRTREGGQGVGGAGSELRQGVRGLQQPEQTAVSVGQERFGILQLSARQPPRATESVTVLPRVCGTTGFGPMLRLTNMFEPHM